MFEDFVAAPLVPEFLVTDLAASLRFWCGLCGFRVVYDRPEEKFAYLDLAGAQVMLEQRGVGRNWETGGLQTPFGRGVNFQIMVPDASAIMDRLVAAGWELFQAYEEAWYRVGQTDEGQGQFLVQDPDGYLLRFACELAGRAGR